jgi:hypothetical protein
MFGNQYERLHRCLPFFGIPLCLRQLDDVLRGVPQRHQRFLPAR